MKTLQISLSDIHLSELQKISMLIRRCSDPDMIVLYGRYAGGTLAGALGGYELLLLTEKKPAFGADSIMRYLCREFGYEERAEKQLSVQLHSIGFVTDLLPRSYFFHMIYQEGIVLYDNGSCRFPRNSELKPATLYKNAVQDTERCLHLGNGFLCDAVRHLQVRSLRLAAFVLFHAMKQMLMAVAWVYFGFLPRTDSLTAFFCCIRHCSPALNGELDMEIPENKRMLRRMDALCREQAYYGDRFAMTADELSGFVRKLQAVQSVVETACVHRIALYNRLRFPIG